MKALTTITMLAAGILFMGCPYESKFPLDTADKSKPDKALVGRWEEKGSDNYLWKCEMDGNQYRIEKQNIEDSDDEPTIYIGWLTEVGGAQWLNVYEQSYSSDREYYFYRVEKKGDGERIKFKAMTDNVTEDFKTADELKAFVKKHMETSFFYNKDDEKTFYKED